MERLEAIGFKQVAEWRFDNDQLKCVIPEDTPANVLYAFVSNREILYIGKTRGTLSQRMYGYQRPGPTQSTNIKSNKLIRETLLAGKAVHVYALADSGLLYYGGFHINLAAGLEDSLVATVKPPWNTMGV